MLNNSIPQLAARSSQLAAPTASNGNGPLTEDVKPAATPTGREIALHEVGQPAETAAKLKARFEVYLSTVIDADKIVRARWDTNFTKVPLPQRIKLWSEALEKVTSSTSGLKINIAPVLTIDSLMRMDIEVAKNKRVIQPLLIKFFHDRLRDPKFPASIAEDTFLSSASYRETKDKVFTLLAKEQKLLPALWEGLTSGEGWSLMKVTRLAMFLSGIAFDAQSEGANTRERRLHRYGAIKDLIYEPGLNNQLVAILGGDLPVKDDLIFAAREYGELELRRLLI